MWIAIITIGILRFIQKKNKQKQSDYTKTKNYKKWN
jgi:hypothetical protein